MNDLGFRIALAKGNGMEWRLAWICMSRFITLPRHTSMAERKRERETANLSTSPFLASLSTWRACVYIYLHKCSFKPRGCILDPASLISLSNIYFIFFYHPRKRKSSIVLWSPCVDKTCDRCFCLFTKDYRFGGRMIWNWVNILLFRLLLLRELDSNHIYLRWSIFV